MIAISDMTGRWTKCSPVPGPVDRVKSNQNKMQARLSMASVVLSYFIARLVWIGRQKWGQGLMVNSLKMVRKATPDN